MNIQNAIHITVQERLERHEETDGEKANPDFYRIALELECLTAHSQNGWWADWGGCMYAETFIRDFGPLVSWAAAACEAGDEGSSETTTVNVLNCVDSYLQWEAVCASSDDEVAGKLIETAHAALDALKVHLLAKADPATQH